jgi:nicotinamide mononucleotide (NMN) deamidase PncC
MITLAAELLGGARVETTLNISKVKLVGKSMRHHTMQRLGAVSPMLIDGLATATFKRGDAPAAIQIAGDLEAAGEDHAVDLIFDAIATKPFSVMRSTPRVADTSISFTLGRLKVG